MQVKTPHPCKNHKKVLHSKKEASCHSRQHREAEKKIMAGKRSGSRLHLHHTQLLRRDGGSALYTAPAAASHLNQRSQNAIHKGRGRGFKPNCHRENERFLAPTASMLIKLVLQNLLAFTLPQMPIRYPKNAFQYYHMASPTVTYKENSC